MTTEPGITPRTMLIDDVLAAYDFRECHAIDVEATPERALEAVVRWRPASSWPWRALLRLRGLGRPAGTLGEWAEANGFLRLAESVDEILYGQAGRFWELRERRAMASPRSVEAFSSFDDPRGAVAVMNFRVEAIGERRTRLSTETRVRAMSAAARRRFRVYWLIIRPFSGLLRRAALRSIARQIDRDESRTTMTS